MMRLNILNYELSKKRFKLHFLWIRPYLTSLFIQLNTRTKNDFGKIHNRKTGQFFFVLAFCWLHVLWMRLYLSVNFPLVSQKNVRIGHGISLAQLNVVLDFRITIKMEFVIWVSRSTMTTLVAVKYFLPWFAWID